MPPPKKPKTGLSRVEAFLTKTEVDDLRREYLSRTSHSSGVRWCSDSSSEFIAHEQSLLSSRMDLASMYPEEVQDLSMHKQEPVESRAESVCNNSNGNSRSCSPHTTKLIDMIMSERNKFASKEGHCKRLEAMLSDYSPGQVAASPAAILPNHPSCIINTNKQIHRKAVSKPMPSLQYVPLRYTDCHTGEPCMQQPPDVSMELIKKVIGASQTSKLDALMRRCAGPPQQWSQATVTCAKAAPKTISSKCLSDTRVSPQHMPPIPACKPTMDLLAEKRNMCKFLESGKNSTGSKEESRLQQMLTSSLDNPLDRLETMLPSCGQWKPDTPANSTDGHGSAAGSPSPATIVSNVCGVTDAGIYQQKQATSLPQKYVKLDAARNNVTLSDEVKCSLAGSLTSLVDTTTKASLTASSPRHLPSSCALTEPQSESTYELPSSTMGEIKKQLHEHTQPQPKSPTEGRLCQICYDSASGFHYGVWSCEGCKAFFKRSLQGPVDYICPATNTCKIDKHRRKSCQACRLRKCLTMGMSKGNCRKDKSSKSGRATKRKAELKDTDTMDAKMFKDDSRSPQCSPQHSFTDSLHTSLPVTHNSLPMALSTSPSGGDLKITEAPPMHPLVEHLLQIDPPVRMTGHDNSQPDSELGLVTSIIKLADLELVDIISWAKAIPGYTDLSLKDRVHLLETCWTEVIVCGLMWRSMPFSDCENLVFAPDLYFNKSRCILSKFWPICMNLSDLRNIFRRLNINREEFVLIRTMVLLNADMNILDTNDKWTEMKRKVNEAFHYTVVTRHGGSYDRLMQILFVLPHIRNVGLQLLRWLFQVKEDRGVLLCDLLQEMLNANTSLHRLNRNPAVTRV